jgi:hypothetical protein
VLQYRFTWRAFSRVKFKGVGACLLSFTTPVLASNAVPLPLARFLALASSLLDFYLASRETIAFSLAFSIYPSVRFSFGELKILVRKSWHNCDLASSHCVNF